MQINLAHLRERSTRGGFIDFAVFEAKSTSGTESSNRQVLSELTAKARASGLKIDQSALAYKVGNRTKYFGDKHLVAYLSKSGVFRWTHRINV